MAGGIDPISAFVRTLDGDYYLVREVADAVGVSQHRLRKAIKYEEPGMLPSDVVMLGKMTVYLYTIEDVKQIKETLANKRVVSRFKDIKKSPALKVGRPNLYTEEQKTERARLFSRVSYWKNRLKLAEKLDDESMQIRAKIMIKDLKEELDKGAKER